MLVFEGICLARFPERAGVGGRAWTLAVRRAGKQASRGNVPRAVAEQRPEVFLFPEDLRYLRKTVRACGSDHVARPWRRLWRRQAVFSATRGIEGLALFTQAGVVRQRCFEGWW